MDYLQVVKELLDNAPIADVISHYLPVQKKGTNFVAVCPFHQDSNPSMMISPAKKIFKCFVCGTGGNAIQFVQKYEKVSFKEAVKKIADIVGYKSDFIDKSSIVKKIELTPEQFALEKINEYYQFSLKTTDGHDAYNYLISRDMSDELIEHFSLGYAPLDNEKGIINLRDKMKVSIDTMINAGIIVQNSEKFKDRYFDRIIFPLADGFGRIVGFSGRVYKESPDAKYINSPESKVFIKSNILYNLHNAKLTARKDSSIYVFEGFMDVIGAYKAGVNSAVAIMGTALTKEHIRILKALNVEVRLCLDGDSAGQLATYKNSQLMLEAGLKFKIVDSTNNVLDPDEIFKEQGKDSLINFLNNLIDPFEFLINYLLNVKKLNPINVLEELLPLYSKITSKIERELFESNVANKISLNISSVREYFSKVEHADVVIARTTSKEKNFDRIADLLVENKNKTNTRIAILEGELMYFILFSELHYSLNKIVDNDEYIFENKMFDKIVYAIKDIRDLGEVTLEGIRNFIVGYCEECLESEEVRAIKEIIDVMNSISTSPKESEEGVEDRLNKIGILKENQKRKSISQRTEELKKKTVFIVNKN